MAKRIKEMVVDKFKDRYDRLKENARTIDKIFDSNKQPRRGIAPLGLKRNKRYELGGSYDK